MLSSILRFIRLVYTVLGYSCMGIAFRWMERDYRRFYHHGYRFCTSVLRLSGVRLHVEGYERLREDENYVFVANHVSLFDIPALWAALGNVIRIRIIYKQQLHYVPVFGWALLCSPFIAIRRDRPRDGMTRLNETVAALREGSSAVIFAEGTRSRTGRLLPFKRGAFMLAARSSKPIVPVAIIGSQNILRAGSLNICAGDIRVVIGEPIPAATAQDAAQERIIEKHLMQHVHQVLADVLPEEMKPSEPQSL
jgi:1-acyl-sn-glycerol-3-phosphate acyltransferase